MRFASTPVVISHARYVERAAVDSSHSVPAHMRSASSDSRSRVEARELEEGPDLDGRSTVLYTPSAQLQPPMPAPSRGPRYSQLYHQISQLPDSSNVQQTSPSTANHNMIQDLLLEVRGMPPTPLRHAGIHKPLTEHSKDGSAGVSTGGLHAVRTRSSFLAREPAGLPNTSEVEKPRLYEQPHRYNVLGRGEGSIKLRKDGESMPEVKGSVTPPLQLRFSRRRSLSFSSTSDKTQRFNSPFPEHGRGRSSSELDMEILELGL